MIRTLALVTLLAGFALGAFAQLAEAPGLVSWSFGAAVVALVLWIVGAVVDARIARGGSEAGAFDPGPAAWDSHRGSGEAPGGNASEGAGASDGGDG